MYILVAMWRLLCQSTEFLFFFLSDYHKSSWSSQICSGYLNHCQRTVWVLMKALPSQGQSCWVSVAECKVIPLYCHEVSQTTSAPADQSPARMSPAHGRADCWGPDTAANTRLPLPLQKELFKLLSGRDDESYKTSWGPAGVWYYAVQGRLKTWTCWCHMGLGLNAKPWRGGNRFQTTTLVKIKEKWLFIGLSLPFQWQQTSCPMLCLHRAVAAIQEGGVSTAMPS